MSDSRRWIGLVAAMALVALAVVLTRSEQLPTGPEPVAWDRVSCDRCRMLVSERSFAAQLQTREGRTLYFDDPGCLLLHQADLSVEPHAVWFHHHREDRWLDRERVGFVSADPSPMGYGLGAVDRAEPEAIAYAEAALRAAKLDRERGGER